ncbi:MULTISPECIES: hypothetical protein [Flexivirga]|nr:hypothetical protein [Flexivirga endophytica]
MRTRPALITGTSSGMGLHAAVEMVGGVVGHPFAGAYCDAKFAVEGFMQSVSTVASEDFVVRRQKSDAVRRFVTTPLADLDGSRVWSVTKQWIQPDGETA